LAESEQKMKPAGSALRLRKAFFNEDMLGQDSSYK